ncbi:MAG: 23S rRNA methyltransferase [Lachnospira sp.]|nr:23S rRNA methyltransferase [Lachnospira sp.]
MPSHIETIVLLSQKHVDEYLKVSLDLDELDITASESEATYAEIKEYIFNNYGVKVSTLYISQIKRKNGIEMRDNYNKSQKADAKVPQCPPEKEKYIVEALKHFQMI